MLRKYAILELSALIVLVVRGGAIETDCQSEGFFASKSEDCRGFHYCAYNADGGFDVVVYQCPEGEEFMPIERRCVPDERYECGNDSEEDPDAEREPSDQFICPSQGRFPNPESLNCSTYYVCVTNTNNELVAQLTKCPPSTIYSMIEKKCVKDSSFTCPYAVTTTETQTTLLPTTESIGFECPAIGRYPDPLSTDCKDYFLCSMSPEGEFIASLARCPDTTVFSPEMNKCVKAIIYQCPAIASTTQESTESTTTNSGFICPGDGRYPDLESPDCTTYYLCMQEATGTLGTLTTCPTSTLFSWIVNKCVPANQFSCPNTEPSTEQSTTQVISTTMMISTTTQQTVDYECTEPGRFPNYDSDDCSTYILCVIDSDGNLVAALAHCPENFIFSSDVNRCVPSILYSCSNKSPSTTFTQTSSTSSSTVTSESTSESNEFACPGLGRYPNPTSSDCKSYYVCIASGEGGYIALLAQCPSTTVFSPESKKCVATTEYQCPIIATSTTVQPSTETTTEQLGFVCPDEGRFPDIESPDCTSYYLCMQSVPGTITGTLAYCPPSTIFSWNVKKCVPVNQFSCPNNKPTTEESTTQVLSTTVIISTTTEQIIDYECTETGRFPNYHSEDCSTYFLCAADSDGTLIAILARCPDNFLFSWDSKRCVPSTTYSCPEKSSTLPTTETPSISTTSQTEFPEAFRCTSAGRFPDTAESNCRTYKYCLQTAVGTYFEYTFNCPVNTLFDPAQSRCSASYVCSYTTPAPTTTTEEPTTVANHECTADGRFPDPEAQNCETYVYCLQTVPGNFLKYTFKCPAGTLFDPTERRCSSVFICVNETNSNTYI